MYKRKHCLQILCGSYATPCLKLWPFQELVYRDSNLVSGTLEALVQKVVPTLDYYPDRAFLFAFLLSSRIFIRPNQLLGQVVFLASANLSSHSEVRISLSNLKLFTIMESVYGNE